MKKLKFVIAVIILYSCSKGEDQQSNIVISSPIIGKWQLNSVLYNGNLIPVWTCNNNFETTEFQSNGVSILNFWIHVQINNIDTCDQNSMNGNFTIANDTLEDVRKVNNSIITRKAKYRVSEVTDTTLKLNMFYLETANNDASNHIISNFIDGDYIWIYEKLN